MKRTPKALARRLQSARRHRMRRRPWSEAAAIPEAGGVNAAVLFTEPFAASDTAAWLEPEANGEANSTSCRY